MGQSVHSLAFRLGKSFTWSLAAILPIASASLYGSFLFRMRLMFEYMEFFFWKYERFFLKNGFIFYRLRLERVAGCSVFFVDMYDARCIGLFRAFLRLLSQAFLEVVNSKVYFFNITFFRFAFGNSLAKYFYNFLKVKVSKIIFPKGFALLYFFFLFSLRLNFVNRGFKFFDFKRGHGGVNYYFLKRFFFFFLYRFVLNCFQFDFRFFQSFLSYKLSQITGHNFTKIALRFSPTCDFRFADLNLISRYVVFKLYNRFSLYESVRPFLYNLLRVPYVKGFFVKGNGRFTRKQRAFYIKHSVGKLSFSTVSAALCYTFSKVKTKYGMCGVHLWVNYDLDFIKRVRFKFM